MKRHLFTVLVIAGGGTLLSPLSVSSAPNEPEKIRQLVQMPVAVAKASEAGVPDRALNRLGSALNQGGADPATFNETIRNAPHMADHLDGITGVGSFVRSQVDAGLRGEELASAIHSKLRELGIPAGGHNGKGPPPIATDFISENAHQAIQRHAPRDIQRGRSGQDSLPGRPDAAGRGPSPRGGDRDIGAPGLGNSHSGGGAPPQGGPPSGGGRPGR